MTKTLVLAEKPSVGKDLARVLGCHNQGSGYFTSGQYIVTWALGHLVTLAEPEAYDQRYKAWQLEDLPMLPAALKLEVIKQTRRQFNIVKELMQKKEVREIVVATDAGREGELVARWILEKAAVKKPLKRLWISSVTDKAIKEGFNKLRNGRDYDNLYASAVARAEADWLVGINATRALTCKYNAQLSCGRVQSPTLAIIATREKEINDFQPRAFYGIDAAGKGIRLVWQDRQTKEFKTFDKDKSDKILAACQHKNAEVDEVNKAYKKSFPPQLYNLTQLQMDANKLFGFSAKETLSVMQSLYENHKILTYPRTDARFISTDIVDTLKDRVRACGKGPYQALAAMILKSPLSKSRPYVDNSKVTDHHAIIPTEEPVSFRALNEPERKIFDLVVKRFLAVLYPPFEYEQTTVKARIGSELFIARGKIVLKQGWKAVYSNDFADEEEGDADADSAEKDILAEQTLPNLQQGDVIKLSGINQFRGDTKPPPPFNEGRLLSAMENPARYMAGEKKDLIKIIGDTGGLGTVATRADIIDKLFNSFLIEKKGKDIWITSKGKQLLELVPEDLKSPALTAEWEKKLDAIARGTLNKEKFTNEMRNYARAVVGEIKDSTKGFKHDNLTRNKCPECGKSLLEVNAKKGKMLVCQDRECGHRDMIAQITNARCPECKKKLELRGQGEGQKFVCKCGYREKLSAFEKRRKKEKSNVSKKDVSNYLHKQKKDTNQQPMNTALADALAKLK